MSEVQLHSLADLVSTSQQQLQRQTIRQSYHFHETTSQTSIHNETNQESHQSTGLLEPPRATSMTRLNGKQNNVKRHYSFDSGNLLRVNANLQVGLTLNKMKSASGHLMTGLFANKLEYSNNATHSKSTGNSNNSLHLPFNSNVSQSTNPSIEISSSSKEGDLNTPNIKEDHSMEPRLDEMYWPIQAAPNGLEKYLPQITPLHPQPLTRQQRHWVHEWCQSLQKLSLKETALNQEEQREQFKALLASIPKLTESKNVKRELPSVSSKTTAASVAKQRHKLTAKGTNNNQNNGNEMAESTVVNLPATNTNTNSTALIPTSTIHAAQPTLAWLNRCALKGIIIKKIEMTPPPPEETEKLVPKKVIRRSSRPVFESTAPQLKRSERLNATQILMKPPHERTRADVATLAHILKRLQALSTLSSFVLTQLCAVWHYSVVPRHRVIFCEGDVGTCYYVILKGQVRIAVVKRQIEKEEESFETRLSRVRALLAPLQASNALSLEEKSETETEKNPTSTHSDENDTLESDEDDPLWQHRDLIEVLSLSHAVIQVATLNTGQSFGDLALVNDRPRAASVFTTKRTHLIRLEKDDYNRAMRFVHDRALKEKLRFVNQLSLLESWTADARHHWAGLCSWRTYNEGSVIVEENASAEELYFVKSGTVKAFRTLNSKKYPGNSVQVLVATYGPLDVFGESCMLHLPASQLPASRATYRASTALDLCVVSRYDAQTRLHGQLPLSTALTLTEQQLAALYEKELYQLRLAKQKQRLLDRLTREKTRDPNAKFITAHEKPAVWHL